MTTKFKEIAGESVRFLGDGTPVTLSAPGSTLELAGTVNIADSLDGSLAGLTVDGTPVQDYTGPRETYNTLGVKTIATSVNDIYVDHPNADGAITLQLPEIDSLSPQKKYTIHFKGEFRYANAANDGRQLIVNAWSSGALGDHMEGNGKDISGTWKENGIVYHTPGSITIQSTKGEYSGGSTNGWVIVHSHLEAYKYQKPPVRVASTANVASIPTGMVAGDTFDGVVLKTHDRILLKNQSSAIENGVYSVVSATEVKRPDEWKQGLSVGGFETRILEGTSAGKNYYCSTHPAASKAGVDPIAFAEVSPTITLGGSDTHVQFNNAGVLGGSANLTFDGTTLAMNAASLQGDLTFGSGSGNGSLIFHSTGSAVLSKSGMGGYVSLFDDTTADVITLGAACTAAITLGNTSSTVGVNIKPSQNASSTTTGALRVVGGLGVAKTIFTDKLRLNDLRFSDRGAVTQITSATTAVDVGSSKQGKITTVSQTLASHAKVVFFVTSAVADSSDIVLLTTEYTGAGSVSANVEQGPGLSGFYIVLTNTSGSSLDDTVVIHYMVI